MIDQISLSFSSSAIKKYDLIFSQINVQLFLGTSKFLFFFIRAMQLFSAMLIEYFVHYIELPSLSHYYNFVFYNSKN